MAAVSEEVERLANAVHLKIGGMLWEEEDTIILLIPREPGFWARVSASPEFLDGAADPLDRWSKGVIGKLATDIGAEAVFPSDGPPYPPFFSWALKSGEAWASPIQMLVHRNAGMMLSLRGALRVPRRLPLAPLTQISPCKTCMDKPCQTSCPVDALSSENYDVIACQNHLRRPQGADCLKGGCLARRSCPLSRKSGRLREQSEFHMRAFLD